MCGRGEHSSAQYRRFQKMLQARVLLTLSFVRSSLGKWAGGVGMTPSTVGRKKGSKC